MNEALYDEVMAALNIPKLRTAPLADHEFTVVMFAERFGKERAWGHARLTKAYAKGHGTVDREMRYVPGNKAAMWVYWVKPKP